jgi:methionyl-tRNA formyltransferase
MNVVFMGTPGFACGPLETLVKSSHNLLAVVTVPDKPVGRGRRLSACEVKLKALEFHIPVLQPDNLRDPEFLGCMTALKADVYVVVAFRILPKKLYSIPALGAINVHASLLPKYRGAAPINQALLHGETETGLTSFFLTKQIDGGDIIDQTTTEIDENENFSSLYDRLSEMAGPFLLKTLDLITRPDFRPRSQDLSLATPAPKISTEDALIDWTADDRQVHNLIRAFSERPGAFTYLDDLQIKILGSLRVDFDSLPDLQPGETWIENKRFFVGTGGRPLLVTRLQPEGKKAMDALSFINGYRIKPYHRFSLTRKEVIN